MNCKKCEGRCCDPVVLSTSPQDITEAYIAIKTGVMKVNDPDEIIKMYHNLTFKGMSRFSPMEAGAYPNGKAQHMYDCNNFDHKTRKCKDYDNRMKFCKAFGETTTCTYKEI